MKNIFVFFLIIAVLGGVGIAQGQRTATAPETEFAEDIEEPPTTFFFQQIRYQSKALSLAGFISRPKGDGPFPAVIYNHGSGCQETGRIAALARFYNDHGWLYFAAVRHGHGGNPGRCIKDVMNEVRSPRDDRRRTEVHDLYNEDVVAAVEWLKQQSYVNPNSIIMTGISFGGIQTLLTAETGLGIRAFIPCAPGAMSWKGSLTLRERLSEAARRAKAPIFLIQAANDYNLGPSERLGPVLDAKGFPNRHQVYPPFGVTKMDGHGFCGKGTEVYGQDLLAFLNDALK